MSGGRARAAQEGGEKAVVVVGRGAARGASAAWRVVRLGAGCEVHRWSVIPLSANQLSDSLSHPLSPPAHAIFQDGITALDYARGDCVALLEAAM